MNITIDSGKPNQRVSMAMRHQVTPARLRMEIVQVSGSAATNDAEGMYTVVNDADSTITSVMPSQHLATVMGLTSTLGLGSGAAPKTEEHLTKNKLEDMGAGERILGHATHRYRTTTAGTLDITIMGQTCTKPFDGVTEMWMASDVDLQPAMSATLKHFGAGQLEDLEKRLRAAPTARPQGTALRTVSKIDQHDEAGNPITVTTTMEFVELEHGPMAASAFDVPPDYKTMDMRTMLRNIPPGMLDSMTRVQSAELARKLCPTTSK